MNVNGSLPTAQNHSAPTEDSHCLVPGLREVEVSSYTDRTY